MKSFKLTARRASFSHVLTTTLCIAVWIAISAPLSAAPTASIQYNLDPAAEQIGPDVDVAGLNLSVRSKSGEALPARLHIRLDAPPKNRLVSTDFPIVEGTHLIDAQAATNTGEYRLRYLFPIRGEYTLTVTASPLTDASPDAWTPVTETFQFTLNENPGEVRNLLLLLAGLFVFGFVAGIILGRGARSANPAT